MTHTNAMSAHTPISFTRPAPKTTRARAALRIGLIAAVALSGLTACTLSARGPFQSAGSGSPILIDRPMAGAPDSLGVGQPERRSIADAVGMAVAMPHAPAESSWATSNGTKGTVTAGPPTLEGIVALDGGLLPVPFRLTADRPLEPVRRTARTRSNVNVRMGPDTEYERLTTISKDSAIEIVAEVSASDWVLVAQEGRALGYLYGRLLRDVEDLDDSAALESGRLPDLEDGAAQARDYSLAELDQALAGAEPLVPALCRPIRQTLRRVDGWTQSWDALVCRITEDRWEVRPMGNPVGQS